MRRAIWAAILLIEASFFAVPELVGAQDEPTRPTIGLALSGGSAKGIAHIGVIRELERLGVHVDVVAGTSMGSVIGGLYAIGLTPDSIESTIANTDFQLLISDATPRSRRFVDRRRLDDRAVLSVPLELTRVSLPSGAIVGSNMLRLLERETWRAAAIRRFAALPRPFVAVATDLETGDAVPLREGVLADAVRASSGVPGALEPFELGGRVLVDGAYSRNLPATDARELGADVVICSDVSNPIESADELESLVDVLGQLTALSRRESTQEQRDACDVLIQPDVDNLSSLTFDRYPEWIERGRTASVQHEAELRALAGPAHGRPAAEPPVAPLLGDSVRIESIEIEGTDRAQVVDLVRRELELEPGDYVGRDGLETALGYLVATDLFGLVRYRLDGTADAAHLTVSVQERPRNRLGMGLRYDDDRRAAILFTATVHNLVGYGSTARLDLRVGEETQIRARLNRRRRVTGTLGVGVAAGWSQAPLELPASEGGRTSLGWEATAQRTEAPASAADVGLVSLAAVLDHETLDRVDFPQTGADVTGRFEWGATDVAPGERFTVAALDARYYIPVLPRLTVDIGAFLGDARGADLPLHRRFYLGGAHRSTVFRMTQPLFQGLRGQAQSGRAVQVGRFGVRWEVRSGTFLRAGVDVGAVRDAWTFPFERPMTGWALSAGGETLIGPVEVEVSKVWGSAHDPRVSVSVGREL
jgi:NTE family protein